MTLVLVFLLGLVAGNAVAILTLLFIFGATRNDRRDEPPSKDDWRGLD